MPPDPAVRVMNGTLCAGQIEVGAAVLPTETGDLAAAVAIANLTGVLDATLLPIPPPLPPPAPRGV